MGKIISTVLPKDLPENWNDTQFVSPGGVEVGLTEKHGYNYLMKQVNNTQKALEELDKGVDARMHYAGFNMMTPTGTGHTTLFQYIKDVYSQGVYQIVAKVNGFADLPRLEWGFTLLAINGEGDIWDVELIEALTNRRFVRQLNVYSSWLQSDWTKVVLSPVEEQVEFNRTDTKGSATLVKNSSANEDFGFSIRDISDEGAEAHINVTASGQMAFMSLKKANEAGFTQHEMLHTGNFYHSAARAGLVEGTDTVTTNEEITSALNRRISSMPANQTRNFILSVGTTGLKLGGGVWFITINKTSNMYASVIATKHHTLGSYISTCSLNEGVLTDWVNITPSSVVPATVE